MFKLITSNQGYFIVLVVSLFCLSTCVFSQSETKAIPDDWKTYAELHRYKKTPKYAETVSYSKRLDAASELLVYKSFGKSSEGRDMPLLIASADGDFSPAETRKSGKAVVFIQAAIHAGESDGKDAGFALLRDIAITKTKSHLLRNVTILFVPIYNVDGHELFSKYNRINQNGPEEMGFRANSAYQNLNRDYLKADTPETIAWLKLWNEWDPDFFIDCHVTDGADFRYNITYEFAHHQEIAEPLRKWMRTHFEGNVVRNVEKDGNLLSRYLQFADRKDPTKGVFTFIATPRFATGYTPLRNRNGLLIEAHSLKNYKSRVRGTYDVLNRVLEEIGENKESLLQANKDADGDTIGKRISADSKWKFPLRQRIKRESKPFQFKGVEISFEESAVSGTRRVEYGKKPVDIVIPQFDSAIVSDSVTPPRFYIIPPQWIEVIRRLSYHGVKYYRTKSEKEFEIESYRFETPKWASRPFEGRITMTFKAIQISGKRKFPKGSVIVPLDQKTAQVAIHWLEPNAPDSAMFWGFFNAIFEQKEYSEGYIIEEIAREMLTKDANLRKEFEKKLEDEKFAKNPRARLNFFYTRSPYYDKNIAIYPVGRIR